MGFSKEKEKGQEAQGHSVLTVLSPPLHLDCPQFLDQGWVLTRLSQSRYIFLRSMVQVSAAKREALEF